MFKTFLILVISFSATIRVDGQPCNAPVGVNMGELSGVLVDVFKTSRSFWESDPSNYIWDTNNPLTRDDNGYPLNIREGYTARTLLLEALDGNYPTGTYSLFYDGQGRIELGMDATNQTFTDNGGIDNKIVFDVVTATNEGIMVDIVETDPDDHVHNIRIIRPDEEGTDYVNTYHIDRFRPLLIERLSNYSVIRFMDWKGTNFSPVQSWSDRTHLSNKSWSTNYGDGAGVPIELLVELSNKTGIDPWFCMPHMADDDYIRRFASFMYTHLDPSLHIYIEYSNEVWNGLFSDDAWYPGQSGQFSYAQQQASARGWTGYWEQIGQWVAQRSVEIFDIWTDVFGDQADRLVKVLPIQNGPGNATPATLSHLVNGRPAYQQVDVVAGAPYFGGSFGPDTPGISGWSAGQLLQRVATDMTAFDSGPYWAEQFLEMINNPPYSDAGLQYVAYEGGQHLANFFGRPEDVVSQLFIEANRHPRMGDLYIDYLEWWQDAGGGMMVLYTHTARPVWGSFGLLEYPDQDTLAAPKWIGVQRWINAFCSGGTPEPVVIPLPTGYALRQNHPNPFLDQTTITIELPETSPVEVSLYDVLGRRISDFYNGVLPAGKHEIIWRTGEPGPGIYFCRMTSGSYTEVIQLVRM